MKQKENIFKKYPWLAHVLAMLAISAVILLLTFFFIRLYARQGKEFELPDMVGRSLNEVQAEDELELVFVVQDSIFRPGQPGGVILAQDPKGGTLVKTGRKVYVSITAYDAEDAVIPELVGLTVRQAIAELHTVGLEVGRLKFVEDPYKNNVIDQSCKGKTVYAGQSLPRGNVIDLVVGIGEGDGETVVPFVIGKTAEKARRDLLTASFNVGRQHFDGVKDKTKAVVYRQEPDFTGVNRHAYGTEVELWYIDADADDIAKMVSTFKVDSSKIVDPETYNDGRPTPEELESKEDWSW